MNKYSIPTTNFFTDIQNNLSNLSNYKLLKYYQTITNFYYKSFSKRGMLIMYDMGYGKTLEAISIADDLRTKYNRKTIILLAKSIVDNFKQNMEIYYNYDEKSKDEQNDIIKNNYKFISLNSSNMFEQMILSSTSKKITHSSLEGITLIIDEAHIFFNAITNMSKNAFALYTEIMNTVDIKLVFLSGTPMINSPIELVSCFNMLSGIELFPEELEEFKNVYIKNDHIANKSKFQNRITGFVSYYGNKFTITKDENFPTVLDIIIIKVKMSESQYLKYLDVREKEKKEFNFGQKNKQVKFNPKGTSSSSYRLKSRLLSMADIPNYANGDINNIKKDDLLKYSPKNIEIIKIINKYSKNKGYIACEFIENQGIKYTTKVLSDIMNMEEFTGNEILDEKFWKMPVKRFAVYSGDIKPELRKQILTVFNDKRNIYGDFVSIILISRAGAMGIELKACRYCIHLSSYWNMMMMEQIESRGNRYLSHIDLPKGERILQPYILLSDKAEYTDNIKSRIEKLSHEYETEETTDIYLYNKSLINKVLINEFTIAMIESSVDCLLNNPDENLTKIKCRKCIPTNKPLYNLIHSKDVLLSDPCLSFVTKKISVKPITITTNTGDNYTYYYDEITNKIYEYLNDMKIYKEINNDNPHYIQILNKI